LHSVARTKRKGLRVLLGITIGSDTSGSVAPCTSSRSVVHNNRLCKDEDIGIISVQGIIHRVTNTKTDSIVSTNNDNNSTPTANANYYNTKSGLSLPSEYGERIMISNDSKYTSISITVIDSNTQHWHIDCIRPSYYTHNKSANYNDIDMCILSSIDVNNVYHLLVRYDWIRDTFVRFVGRPSTLISVCNVGTLHNSGLIYDMDASMHTDEDIEDRMYQDGERQMSMHINVNEFEVADCMAATHNVSSWDNVNMRKHCKVKYHVNNTRECSVDRFTFECKNIGAVNGMYKCTGNTTYNSLAIRTGSWIVLILSYMYTALHQLKSNEHKIVCNRLDGRGVTNVEHLGNIRYASNLSELKRYL